MMRHLLESSGWTLEHNTPFYFPAYLLACGAVELMGRCVMEEKEPVEFQRTLRRGLERMIEVCSHGGASNIRGAYSTESWRADESHIVVSAGRHTYTIGDCIAHPPTHPLVFLEDSTMKKFALIVVTLALAIAR